MPKTQIHTGVTRRRRTVLLTGATGYVGRRVLDKLLAKGDRVIAVVRNRTRAAALPPGCEPLVADLRQTELLVAAARTAEAVLHTGFPGHGTSWSDSVEIEAGLIRAWTKALGGSGKTIVVSSGTAFLGDAAGKRLTESAPIQPDHPAAARARATAPVLHTKDVRGVELRLASFVFGDGGSIFLPALVRFARGTRRSLYVGTGQNRLSTVHVDDAAEAFVRALDTPTATGVFNIAADESPTMRQLAEAVAVGAHASPESVSPAEAAALIDPFTAMFLELDNGLSSRRARLELDWEPTSSTGLLWDAAFGSYAVPG